MTGRTWIKSGPGHSRAECPPLTRALRSSGRMGFLLASSMPNWACTPWLVSLVDGGGGTGESQADMFGMQRIWVLNTLSTNRNPI